MASLSLPIGQPRPSLASTAGPEVGQAAARLAGYGMAWPDGHCPDHPLRAGHPLASGELIKLDQRVLHWRGYEHRGSQPLRPL